MRNSIDARYYINDLEKCQAKLMFVEKYLVSRINGSVPIKIITRITKIREEINTLISEIEHDKP